MNAQRGELLAARETLSGIHITRAGRKAIQAAASALDVATRTRDNAATCLTIEAQQALDWQLDGEPVTLRAGETLDRHVAAALQLEIPELAHIRIAPATSAGELAAEVDARQQETGYSCWPASR
ncbi:hypothetical protein [Haliea sp.]|uniref:hypothetical protein n=1 Tax=Haliea sp. TaxID=1932666 RepID=UPI003527F29E